MQRFAQGIVRHRKLILIIAVLLLIPAGLCALATPINYDILTYLPSDLESMKGEQALEDDFNIASTAMITVEGLPAAETAKMKEEIAAVKGVSDVFWAGDVLDVTVPHELLPADIDSFLYGKHDAAMMIVRFDGASASESTMAALKEIQTILRKDCFIGGMSVILQNTKELVNTQLPGYILCAVGCCLLVLLLSLRSTAIPFIFLLGILFPIVYNFGTNLFLGQISYITQALSTVLQLGVTMDFSIFLLHRYDEEKQNADAETAMAKAISKTFASITGSSLTTIAGFLALCAMRLTLGRDIGVVMAKGVLLGVICTLTVLPAMILQFDKLVHRFTHPTLIPRLTRTSKFVARHYIAVLAVFVVLFIPFALAQSKTPVYYTLTKSLPKDMNGIVGTEKLGEDFGMTSTHFVLTSDELSAAQLNSLSGEMEKTPGVTGVLSYEKFLGPALPEQLAPQTVAGLFHAGGRRLLLVNSAYESGTEEMTAQLDELNGILKKYDPSGMITGEGAMTNDLIQVADVDFKVTNILSVAAVFLIIAVVFRSLSVPVLLVAAIEAAISVNMGISYFTGATLPFIAGIVIGTIQLGATVDYAILMTTRFKEELAAGANAKAAARIAIEQCSQSILTSGLSFFAATVGVSFLSSVELLQSICLLISRGALISMAVIILVLPALLILTAPIIKKTSWHWPAKKETMVK